MVRRLVLAGLLVLPGRVAIASETPPHIALRYNAPDACPDDAQLVASVEGFLGQPLREAREQQLSATVTVQGGAAGFAAKLTFTSPRGTEERFAEDADCSKLAEAAALLVALAIDPERVHAKQAATEGSPEPAPAAPTPEPAPEAPAKPSPAAPCPEPPTPQVAPERHAFASTMMLASVGVLPTLSPGLGFDVGAGWGRLRGALVGSYWFPSTTERALDGSQIEVSLVTAGLRACGAQPLREWTALVCAQGDLGRMSGSGQHVDAAETRHALFGSLQLQAFAQYSKVQPAPLLGLGVAWLVARPPFGVTRLDVGPPQEAFRSQQLALLAYLGVSVGP